MAEETIGYGSPQLDAPLRSRERAALDIAVRELRAFEKGHREAGYHHTANMFRDALERISTLCPEAVK